MGNIFMKGIGIDVGLNGAIACVGENGARYEVHDMPVMKVGSKKEYDMVRLLEILESFRAIGAEDGGYPCYVEKVGAMPKQGVTSMFRFGMGYGIAQMAVIGAGHRMSLITPSVWKSRMLKGHGKDKAASLFVAQNLFPAASLLGPRGGAKDGRAEALLLAELARRENFGGGPQ